ncbi:MAG: tetratricopeptide repeat protein [Tepidisphaeraceae bacterium]
MSPPQDSLSAPQGSEASLLDLARRNDAVWRTSAAAALVVLTLLAYVPAMRGNFIWDDDYHVLNNKNLRSLDGLQRIWTDLTSVPTRQYYPLTHTSFWIEWQLWGAHPVGYHIVNVLLHACAAMLLWLLLKRLAIPGAWVAAAVLALHPVNVESVAWISERKNVLSLVFYLASILVYLRFCGLTPAPPGEKKWFSLPDERDRLYWLALFLYACAITSKSVTATLPVAVLLILWWKRGRIGRDDIVPLLPLIAIGLAYGATTIYLENRAVGASGPEFDYAPTLMGEAAFRTLVAGRAVWFYATKLLIPYPLIFIYPRWSVSVDAPLQYAFPVLVVVTLWALWLLRHRIGRGPFAAAMFFLVSLFPAMGFVNVWPMRYSFVADHFQYLASIGLIVLVVAALKTAFDRLIREQILNPSALPSLAIIVLGIYFLMVWRQGYVYADSYTLWQDTLNPNKNPRSWMARNNYGLELQRRGNLSGAEMWYLAAIRSKPDHREARYNLGMVALEREQPDVAMSYFQDALRVSPDYADAIYQIAQINARRGSYADAASGYRKVIDLVPDHEMAHFMLGSILQREGKPEAAATHYRRALDLNPQSVPALNSLALTLSQMGQNDQAVQLWNEVVRLDPQNSNVYNSLGAMLASNNQLDLAAEQFRRALRIKPDFADAHNNLGLVYLKQRKLKDAISEFETALQINPDFEKARTNLAAANERLHHGEKPPATTPQ